MTSRSVWMAAAIAALTCVGAAADGTVVIRAHVPFDFMVGDTRLPAGEYAIAQDRFHGSIHISSRDTGAYVALLRTPAGNNFTGYRTALVFNRYGSRYFLRQIWSGAGTLGVQLPVSRTEKEEMARHAPTSTRLTATLER